MEGMVAHGPGGHDGSSGVAAVVAGEAAEPGAAK